MITNYLNEVTKTKQKKSSPGYYYCHLNSLISSSFIQQFFFHYQKLLILLINIHSKILELEEELKVVGNNMKSLEVSEQEVHKKTCYFRFDFYFRVVGLKFKQNK